MKKLLLFLTFSLSYLITFSQSGCIAGDCKNGEGTFVYPSGEKYTGSFVDGKRVGKGVSVLQDLQRYEGNWAGDKKNGQGTFTWPNGDKHDLF